MGLSERKMARLPSGTHNVDVRIVSEDFDQTNNIVVHYCMHHDYFIGDATVYGVVAPRSTNTRVISRLNELDRNFAAVLATSCFNYKAMSAGPKQFAKFVFRVKFGVDVVAVGKTIAKRFRLDCGEILYSCWQRISGMLATRSSINSSRSRDLKYILSQHKRY